jgi:hypothetical protein
MLTSKLIRLKSADTLLSQHRGRPTRGETMNYVSKCKNNGEKELLLLAGEILLTWPLFGEQHLAIAEGTYRRQVLELINFIKSFLWIESALISLNNLVTF